jgi:hypothetical protein
MYIGLVGYKLGKIALVMLFSGGTFLFVATMHILPETISSSGGKLAWSDVSAVAGVHWQHRVPLFFVGGGCISEFMLLFSFEFQTKFTLLVHVNMFTLHVQLRNGAALQFCTFSALFFTLCSRATVQLCHREALQPSNSPTLQLATMLLISARLSCA